MPPKPIAPPPAASPPPAQQVAKPPPPAAPAGPVGEALRKKSAGQGGMGSGEADSGRERGERGGAVDRARNARP
jgi:hypothetical protein